MEVAGRKDLLMIDVDVRKGNKLVGVEIASQLHLRICRIERLSVVQLYSQTKECK